MEHRGLTIWFTGLPCSGKTTVATILVERLKNMGIKAERLDGDVVRQSLTKDLGFSKEDRDKNIERITFVAELLTRNGVLTLVSFISPYTKKRDEARTRIKDFIEVYVKCPVEECERRDVKGMYKKARAGEIKNFTGVDDPYEEPLNAEIVLETDKEIQDESADKVVSYLLKSKILEDKFYYKYESEEEEKIRKRLKSLGYIE